MNSPPHILPHIPPQWGKVILTDKDVCIGKGSFGLVMRLVREDKQKLAVKIVLPPLASNKKQIMKFNQQAKRERRIMRRVQGAPHVLNLLKSKLRVGEHALHLIPRFQMNLRQYIHTHPFTLDAFDEILTQTLLGLNELYARGIIHCDLKPDNILVNAKRKLHVVICDFSLSRIVEPECEIEAGRSHLLTEKNVLRPYDAPELFVHTEPFAHQIDVWSVGCMFAEFALGALLFDTTVLSTYDQYNHRAYFEFVHQSHLLRDVRDDVDVTIESFYVAKLRELKLKLGIDRYFFCLSLLRFFPQHRATAETARATWSQLRYSASSSAEQQTKRMRENGISR